MTAPSLQMRQITVRFPGVLANDRVNLTVESGEIHALLGENGAGKSTLMNVLYGLYAPDTGEILLDGRPVRFAGPRDAIAHRIGMVHQHFMLVPPLTVADNIMLGQETARGPFLDRERAAAAIAALSREYGLPLDPAARVADLPVGMQQRVEIVKTLYRGADILIMDEPTAVLTPAEADELLAVLRGLAKGGRSVIFISHKLREVLAVADRITVLRAGRVVGEVTPAESTPESLAALMVGRPVLLRVEKGAAHPGEPVLRVENLTVRGDRGLTAVDDLSLEVRAGEIVGLAGVEGNGQAELIEALTGLRPGHGGRIWLAGRDLTSAPPRAFIDAGVGHIPADRQKFGLVLSEPLADNLVLSTYERPPFARGLRRVFAAIRAHALRMMRAYDIRAPRPETIAGALSGGNQQKTVVARELDRPNRLLIAAQPTRGVDVGSTEFIHRSLVAARDRGVAVLLVSAELDEVLSLSDRIAVIYRGRIAGVLDAGDATPERVGLLMAGGQTATV